MHSSWKAFHASFSRSIRTLEANQAFLEAKRHRPVLARFDDAGEVVAFLTSKHGDLDKKDRLLATLVTMVQQGKHRELACNLLWLGLWPGLDAVFRRRVRHFEKREQELVSDLGFAFTVLVERLNLKSITRVAAALVWSTERSVMDGRKRVWAEAARIWADRAEPRVFDDFISGTGVDKVALDHWTKPRADSVLGITPGLSLESDVAALRAWLDPIVGEDTELLIAVIVLEETQLEAARRLGLSHDAARKRFQRALGRIREHVAAVLSHFAEPDRI